MKNIENRIINIKKRIKKKKKEESKKIIENK